MLREHAEAEFAQSRAAIATTEMGLPLPKEGESYVTTDIKGKTVLLAESAMTPFQKARLDEAKASGGRVQIFGTMSSGYDTYNPQPKQQPGDVLYTPEAARFSGFISQDTEAEYNKAGVSRVLITAENIKAGRELEDMYGKEYVEGLKSGAIVPRKELSLFESYEAVGRFRREEAEHKEKRVRAALGGKEYQAYLNALNLSMGLAAPGGVVITPSKIDEQTAKNINIVSGTALNKGPAGALMVPYMAAAAAQDVIDFAAPRVKEFISPILEGEAGFRQSLKGTASMIIDPRHEAWLRGNRKTPDTSYTPMPARATVSTTTTEFPKAAAPVDVGIGTEHREKLFKSWEEERVAQQLEADKDMIGWTKRTAATKTAEGVVIAAYEALPVVKPALDTIFIMSGAKSAAENYQGALTGDPEAIVNTVVGIGAVVFGAKDMFGELKTQTSPIYGLEKKYLDTKSIQPGDEYIQRQTKGGQTVGGTPQPNELLIARRYVLTKDGTPRYIVSDIYGGDVGTSYTATAKDAAALIKRMSKSDQSIIASMEKEGAAISGSTMESTGLARLQLKDVIITPVKGAAPANLVSFLRADVGKANIFLLRGRSTAITASKLVTSNKLTGDELSFVQSKAGAKVDVRQDLGTKIRISPDAVSIISEYEPSVSNVMTTAKGTFTKQPGSVLVPDVQYAGSIGGSSAYVIRPPVRLPTSGKGAYGQLSTAPWDKASGGGLVTVDNIASITEKGGHPMFKVPSRTTVAAASDMARLVTETRKVTASAELKAVTIGEADAISGLIGRTKIVTQPVASPVLFKSLTMGTGVAPSSQRPAVMYAPEQFSTFTPVPVKYSDTMTRPVVIIPPPPPEPETPDGGNVVTGGMENLFSDVGKLQPEHKPIVEPVKPSTVPSPRVVRLTEFERSVYGGMTKSGMKLEKTRKLKVEKISEMSFGTKLKQKLKQKEEEEFKMFSDASGALPMLHLGDEKEQNKRVRTGYDSFITSQFDVAQAQGQKTRTVYGLGLRSVLRMQPVTVNPPTPVNRMPVERPQGGGMFGLDDIVTTDSTQRRGRGGSPYYEEKRHPGSILRAIGIREKPERKSGGRDWDLIV